MIKIVIDCNYKYNETLEKYIKQIPSAEITDYKDLNSDFILIKEIENEKDLKMLKDLKKLQYKFNVISLISTEKFVLDLLDLQMIYFIKKDKLKENLFIINECMYMTGGESHSVRYMRATTKPLVRATSSDKRASPYRLAS